MFAWKDSFSVSIKEIDEQHKELFAIAGKLMDALKGADEEDYYDGIKEILNELDSYTKYHFNYEENLLKTNSYEALDKHKAEHEEFIAKLGELSKQDIYIKQKGAMMNILSFLIDWISNHIVKEDMNYKSYLNNRGII